MSGWRREIRVEARARGAFVITTYSTPRKRAHLVTQLEACWQMGKLVRLHARTACEAQIWRAAVHADVPDGVELCDACVFAKFPGAYSVYRMFDRFGRLLYVGCTRSLLNRFRAHSVGQRPSPWWPLVDHWTYEGYDSRAEALRAEAAAIVAERPFFNVDLTDHASHPRRRRSANLHLTAATS